MAELNETVETTVVETNEVNNEVKVEKQKKTKDAPKKKKASAFGKIGKFFRDTVSELRKVVWTPKEDVRKNTILVVVSVIVFAVVIGVIDVAGAYVVDFLASLWK